jgi:hypothetical protein
MFATLHKNVSNFASEFLKRRNIYVHKLKGKRKVWTMMMWHLLFWVNKYANKTRKGAKMAMSRVDCGRTRISSCFAMMNHQQ